MILRPRRNNVPAGFGCRFMKQFKRSMEFYFMTVSMAVFALSLFLLPNYVSFDNEEDNLFHVILNGEEVGVVDSEDEAREYLIQARREIAGTSDEMLFINAELEIEGEHVFWGETDSARDVIDSMKKVLSKYELLTYEHCYSIRIGEYIFNMGSVEEIEELLNSVLEVYDSEKEYIVSIYADNSREVNALTYTVLTTVEQEEKEQKEEQQATLPSAGIELTFSDWFESVDPVSGLDFEDYALGLQSISFGEEIEIAETYLPSSQITSVEKAIEDLTGSVEKETTYEVQDGDSLSVIAENYGLTTEELVEINGLSGTDAIIRPGDVLQVTVSEAKLTVIYTTQEYYEEDYYADTQYVENDSWYTTKSEVVQEASAGHRRVIALVTYRDDLSTGTDIIKEEITVEAVPKIIEVGTVNPPTYIWPCYGTISSYFGSRSSPTAGASTNHKGIDIAVSTGTSVMATSGGTVTVAGWQSGYGYVVYIDHGNGVVSRYGHLSKILVSVGQTVSQGDVIARSGNTGNSTGPHLHFEIRVNGTAVNPLSYLN